VTVLQYVAVALAALDEILKAGGNAAALLAQLRTTIGAFQAEKRDPTDAEWQALDAQIATAMEALG
jgi:N-acyl-D-aspartate/D-glutamate deacylase